MSCTNPNYALKLGKVDGKWKIKFLPKRMDQYSLHVLEDKYGKDAVLVLPCGQCTSCKLSYARQWAVRCSLEASCYDQNLFVTLTYNDLELPYSKAQARRDIQLFLKRVRKVFPGIRYFGCCEKGDVTGRLHHHLILFNCDPPDLVPYAKRGKDSYIFKSRMIEKLWNKGLIDIGEVTFNSCSYVARYVYKKSGEKDPDEFIYMSTRPAIGKAWFDAHAESLMKYDQIFFNFGSSKQAALPRYFDKLIERIDPLVSEQMKARRIDNSNLSSIDALLRYGLEYREEMYDVQDANLRRKVKRLKRGL